MMKRDNKRTGDKQVIESPILDMSFIFTDAPSAIANVIKSDKKDNQEIEMKKEIPKKSSICKVSSPKKVKKKPDKKEKVELELIKSKKRVKDNLRIDMVGYDQRPNYFTRSHPNKQRKMKECFCHLTLEENFVE